MRERGGREKIERGKERAKEIGREREREDRERERRLLLATHRVLLSYRIMTFYNVIVSTWNGGILGEFSYVFLSVSWLHHMTVTVNFRRSLYVVSHVIHIVDMYGLLELDRCLMYLNTRRFQCQSHVTFVDLFIYPTKCTVHKCSTH